MFVWLEKTESRRTIIAEEKGTFGILSANYINVNESDNTNVHSYYVTVVGEYT